MSYQPVIGLEIHSQLKTKSKMFCGTPNGFGLETEPNVNICPVCTGQPGSLPVINKKAVELVVKTGLALNCEIADESWFERKNYFYPDLPKGYQISQYEKPLCKDGYLETVLPGGEKNKIRINRVHLEEDTGKLIHDQDPNYSLVDFNRAGVPLMELVTEPDIISGKQARKFCEEFQLILRYLDVSDADMEKGQMRCEVNISLKNPDGSLGTKVEIKNLNSFKAVADSIDFEIKRQSEVLDKGEKVIQETRGWDGYKTLSQRTKEEAHDYRYFPEPDLPPIEVTEIKQSIIIPELPPAKRERFIKEYQLPAADIEVFINDKDLADYFEKVVSELNNWENDSQIEDGRVGTRQGAFLLIKLSANYIITELQKLLYQANINLKDCKINPENFAEFVVLVGQNKISSSAAQTVQKEMFDTGKDPSQIIEDKDLAQISDIDQLEEAIKNVIVGNQSVVNDYKNGKEQALQFLIGQVMKQTKGKANPAIVKEMLLKILT